MRQLIKPGTTYAMNETVAISGRFNNPESLSGKMAQEGHGCVYKQPRTPVLTGSHWAGAGAPQVTGAGSR